jgi:hypothetical protein
MNRVAPVCLRACAGHSTSCNCVCRAKSTHACNRAAAGWQTRQQFGKRTSVSHSAEARDRQTRVEQCRSRVPGHSGTMHRNYRIRTERRERVCRGR